MLEVAITFGGQYGAQMYGADPHPTLGIYSAKDGYVIVEAETRGEAREKAFKVLGERWSFDYESAAELDPMGNGWYPLGEIGRIGMDGVLVVHDPVEVRLKAQEREADRG